MAKGHTQTRRIALFVEGDTEHGALKAFFHNWLDAQLPKHERVGIQPVKFQGVSNYLDDLPKKVELQLEGRADFVFGLVDLYGLPPDRFDFAQCTNVKEKVIEARKTIKKLIPAKYASRFRQHFAVHEVEAWLLAYPELFPAEVRSQFTKRRPEDVNFREPPAKFLKRILGRYQKTVFSRNKFPAVDPQIAIDKCPYLRLLADDLLAIAKRLG